MMDLQANILIRDEFRDTAIAFNNSGIVLKSRPLSDLIDLAIMAHRSKDPGLLKLFQDIPSLEDLKKLKMDLIVHKTVITDASKTINIQAKNIRSNP